MAANQKSVFATQHITYGGRIFQPGTRIDDKLEPDVVGRCLEAGIASEDTSEAKQASEGERERVADVQDQIANRSEKREKSNRGE